ncbi:MAG: response regulator [Rhodobacteraceae bacterium]|nr:response regulator [Paracoccaceae bacterium]
MNSVTELKSAGAESPNPAQTPDRPAALILDDSVVDRRKLKSVCDKADLALDFHEVDSITQMREALNERQYDIIFIDYRLTDGDGLKALEIISTHPSNRLAATIMIAGVAQASIAVSALKAGCSDYILKDALDPNWLRRAVINALEKSRLRQEFDSSEETRVALLSAMKGFSKDCVEEMKPLLSRMMRQVRRIRGRAMTHPGGIPEIEELESSCRRLWQFLEEIETYSDRYR